MFELLIFEKDNQRSPFNDWLCALPLKSRVSIASKLAIISDGNWKSVRHLKGSLFEIKFYSGPGYRVYFSLIGKKQILILLGGIKSSQKRDIQKAKKYLLEYLKRNQND